MTDDFAASVARAIGVLEARYPYRITVDARSACELMDISGRTLVVAKMLLRFEIDEMDMLWDFPQPICEEVRLWCREAGIPLHLYWYHNTRSFQIAFRSQEHAALFLLRWS